VCEEPTKFEVGKDRYPWPAHWRGVICVFSWIDFPLNRVSEDEMKQLKLIHLMQPFMKPMGVPCFYAVVDGVMEVYPVPDRELEMLQAPERPCTST
jgi:hypothetical protein